MCSSTVGVQASIYRVALSMVAFATWKLTGIQTRIRRILLGTTNVNAFRILYAWVAGAFCIAIAAAIAITPSAVAISISIPTATAVAIVIAAPTAVPISIPTAIAVVISIPTALTLASAAFQALGRSTGGKGQGQNNNQ